MLAADLLKKLDKGKNLKAIVYNMKCGKFLGPLFKIGSEYRYHKRLILAIYDRITEKQQVKNAWMFKVLIFELFLGAGKITGGGALKRILKTAAPEIEKEFASELAEARERIGHKSNRPPTQLRHYYKGQDGAIEELKTLFEELKSEVAEIRSLEFDDVCVRDYLVHDLVNMENKIYAQLKRRKKLQNFIVQGWSSCLPPFFLKKHIKVKKGDIIVDGCSAPGNKTLQLVKYFPEQKIKACEMDFNRFNLLQDRLKQYHKDGQATYEATNMNFTDLDPTDPENQKIKVIMLDPTCSGTGMRNRSDQNHIDFNRIKKISDMQLSLVLHACKFPSVKYVCFSTCSTDSQENEFTVIRTFNKLKAFRDVLMVDLFSTPMARVEKEATTLDRLKGVKRGYYKGDLGEEHKDELSKCLRVCKTQAKDGFFVAIFELGKMKE